MPLDDDVGRFNDVRNELLARMEGEETEPNIKFTPKPVKVRRDDGQYYEQSLLLNKSIGLIG